MLNKMSIKYNLYVIAFTVKLSKAGNGLLPVGLFINPSVPPLGSSPDRRVYDPTEVSPWGLLELKCTMHEQLSELNYLKLNDEEGSIT